MVNLDILATFQFRYLYTLFTILLTGSLVYIPFKNSIKGFWHRKMHVFMWLHDSSKWCATFSLWRPSELKLLSKCKILLYIRDVQLAAHGSHPVHDALTYHPWTPTWSPLSLLLLLLGLWVGRHGRREPREPAAHMAVAKTNADCCGRGRGEESVLPMQHLEGGAGPC